LALYSPAAGLYLPETPLREHASIRGWKRLELTPEIIRVGRVKVQNNSARIGYNIHMPDSKELVDQQLLEMRWRTLSLAADFDRIHRAAGGPGTLAQHAQIAKLRRAFQVLLSDAQAADRAEQVQMIFSDMTPPPK
jgi:hypothetical protein